jgi:hypothetical protein
MRSGRSFSSAVEITITFLIMKGSADHDIEEGMEEVGHRRFT